MIIHFYENLQNKEENCFGKIYQDIICNITKRYKCFNVREKLNVYDKKNAFLKIIIHYQIVKTKIALRYAF